MTMRITVHKKIGRRVLAEFASQPPEVRVLNSNGFAPVGRAQYMLLAHNLRGEEFAVIATQQEWRAAWAALQAHFKQGELLP